LVGRKLAVRGGENFIEQFENSDYFNLPRYADAHFKVFVSKDGNINLDDNFYACRALLHTEIGDAGSKSKELDSSEINNVMSPNYDADDDERKSNLSEPEDFIVDNSKDIVLQWFTKCDIAAKKEVDWFWDDKNEDEDEKSDDDGEKFFDQYKLRTDYENIDIRGCFIKLNLKQSYDVKITHIASPNEIYVNVISNETSCERKLLMEKLHSKLKRLKTYNKFSAKSLAVIEQNYEFHRAVFLHGDANNAVFLCVDTGKMIFYDRHDNNVENISLYRMPSKVFSVCPFQVAKLRLSNIEVINDIDCIRKIESSILDKVNNLLVVVEKSVNDQHITTFPISPNYYEVRLYNRDTYKCINDILIEKNLATLK
jgi:hypothetical protein